MDHIEHVSNTDHLTGLHKDILSFLVFTFFPTSSRHFRLRENFCGAATLDSFQEDKDVIFRLTGSLPEHLDLPILLTETKGELKYVIPDQDVMILNDHTNDHIIVKTQGVRPGYCRVAQLIGNTCRLINPTMFRKSIKQGVNFMGEVNVDMKKSKRYENILKMANQSVTSESVSLLMSATSHLYGDKDFEGTHDLVSTVSIPIPTVVASKFLERISGKAWPPYEHVEGALREGCHAIPKKNPFDSEGYDWRISFSGLEVKLARTLNDVQRICYRVLKAVVMSEINQEAPEEEKLASYFLKTTLFWLCEEMHPDNFVQKNIANIWIALLDKIIVSVSEGNIRNYFIPDCNMIEHVPRTLTRNWLVKLHHIRKNPIKAFQRFWTLFDLNTFICERGRWNQYYIATLQIIEQVPEDEHKSLLERSVTHPLLTFYLLDSNITDWKRCIELCQDVSYNGPSGIINDFFGGNVLDYLLHASLPMIYGTLENGLEREDSHLFADLGCILQQRSIENPLTPFELAPEQLYSAAVDKSHDTPLVAVVKYANYLRSQQRYEELTSLVIQYLKVLLPREKYLCVFSQFTPDILDDYMRWVLWSLPEIAFSSNLLLYYFLILGYQKAGVLAEVFMPGYFVPKDKTGWDNLQRVVDFAIIWASLLCHAGLYDSAFYCCFSDSTPYFYIYLNGILYRFMFKCIAELFLQLKQEYVEPSGVFDKQRQLRQTWRGAMRDFPREFPLSIGILSEQQKKQLQAECKEVVTRALHDQKDESTTHQQYYSVQKFAEKMSDFTNS